MKILYIVHQFYPEFHSGTEKFLLNLSSAVQRYGHSVQIATYTYTEPREEDLHDDNLFVRNYAYESLPVVSVRHRNFPTDLHTSCSNPDIYRFAIDFLQREAPFDLVHIAHPMRLTAFAKAAMDLKIPYVLTLTDFWMLCPNIILQTNSGSLCIGPEGGRICRELCSDMKAEFITDRLVLARGILRDAKALVSPSRFLASVFEKEFPVLKPRVIPHGMDFRNLRPNTKEYCNQDDVVFAYCGTLSPHKGVHLLLEAFLKLDPKNGRLKLYGSSFHETDYFNHLLEIAGKDGRIEFCGAYTNTQVGEILANVDALVLPSLCYENYPFVLHEALACGVPVIASDVGGMAEKVKDSVNGFTFRFGDELDLANKLKLILDAPEILNDLKKNTREFLLPPVEEEAYLYGRLYKTVLGESGY